MGYFGAGERSAVSRSSGSGTAHGRASMPAPPPANRRGTRTRPHARRFAAPDRAAGFRSRRAGATGSGSRPSRRHGQNERGIVVGRKNWLFADTVRGANASANLYSLVETAKANQLEPYAYLRLAFTALPRAQTLADFEALLPRQLDRARLHDASPVSANS